ncbi:MAG: DUF2752 domain-containing protein [Oribacterium sp.]|nr:DUF2752 domain-containing protein [Oribacterium sp.]
MVLGIGCPVKFLTGVSDAGCGMSRAWLSVLHLDFARAFYYHPLWMLPVPAVLAIFFKKRIPEKIYRFLVICFVALFLMVYGYRMFFMPDQDIVVFRPWEGFIWRSIETIAIVIKSLL